MRQVFDGFELDRESFQLYRAGIEVPVERRALDLLCYFVAHPRRLISREELLEHVWHARTLSEGVLANTLAKLRKAIGQPADGREPIETVRGRGYRFHGVARQAAEPDDAVATSARRRGESSDPFVGRHHALDQLIAALDQSAAGQGQLFVIAGEAGIGKTRIVSEFEKYARARNVSVWSGAAYDGCAAPAYWPWVEILRAAQEQLSPNVWRQKLPANHAALARLVPELCIQVAGVESDAQTLRFTLFDELARFLKAASQDAPRLIIIDDLHWADAAAIELLAYAARALERNAVLFVAALREHDGGGDEHHDAALRRLERVATRISLQGLSHEEVAELTGALTGAEYRDATLIDALCERTQGNPLFVRQMLGWLAQLGALSASGLMQLSTADLPPALRGVIQQRIAVLDEETRIVLSAAAVAGREFDANLVAHVLERSLEQVLSAIEPALDLRVLEQRAPQSGQAFAFTHSLLRDGLYEALGVTRRGLMHAKLAQALLARGDDADPRRVGDLARHVLLAVPAELEACVVHCRNAAAAARASSGFEAAAELLSRLIQKHESEGGELHVRCELLLALATDQFCAGEVRASWDTLRRGADLGRQLGAARLLARFAIQLAPWSEFGGGDEAYVRSILEQSMRTLHAGDSDLRASLSALRAELESERPLEERYATLDEADALAEQCDTPEVLLQVAYSRAVMRAPIALADNRAAIERFRSLDARHRQAYADPLGLQRSFFVEWLGYRDALTHCELEAAHAAAARCRTLALGANMMSLDLLMALLDAGRALGDGRLDALEENVHRLRESAGIGGSIGVAWVGYAVLLAYERGALANWVDSPQGREQLLARFPGHQRINMEISLAWTAAHAGNMQAAAQLLAAVPSAAVAHMPRQRGDLDTLCALSESYCLLGDRAGAARVFPRLAPFAALNAVGSSCDYRGAVAHYLGLLSVVLGKPAEADAYFERAEGLNQKLQMPLQLARTRAERERLSS